MRGKIYQQCVDFTAMEAKFAIYFKHDLERL
jgi:hypothetical protein